jgi:hypothetical protein
MQYNKGEETPLFLAVKYILAIRFKKRVSKSQVIHGTTITAGEEKMILSQLRPV